ncbi:MAG: LamG domain-containing protein [Candidatus Pacebacteria bacterium]|nr:LamG domain-containing protein [Candidatus Paceibacterota bacterium]
MQSTNYIIDKDSVNFGGSEESTSASYKLSDTMGEIGTGESSEKCSALSFDGNDSISIGNSDSLNITSAITLSAWIKPTTNEQANSPEILTKGGDAHGYRLRMSSTGGIVGSRFYGTTNVDTYTTSSMSTDSFNLITATYGGGFNNTYKNGVLESREVNSGSISIVTSNLYIGSIGGTGEFFSGVLDDVRIYNRALSETEVADLYNGNQVDDTGLVGYWSFDEGSGSTTADLSGSGNTGTISGATFTTDTPSATCSILNAGYRQDDTFISTISISSPDDVILGPSFGGILGGIGTGSADWTVTTDDPAGYQVSIKATTTPALIFSAYSFADYMPGAGIPDYDWTVTSSASEFGYSVEGTNTVSKFLDNGTSCDTGSGNASDKCWLGFSTSDESVATSSSSNDPSGTATTIKFRAEAGSQRMQQDGTYIATVVVTAVSL